MSSNPRRPPIDSLRRIAAQHLLYHKSGLCHGVSIISSARRLGVLPRTLKKWMKELGINYRYVVDSK